MFGRRLNGAVRELVGVRGGSRGARLQARPALESLEGRQLMTLSPISPGAGYPYTTGVELQITYPDGKHFVGSGTMVGANDVLTAGHVVYDYAEGGWATSIVATPEYSNGSGRFGSASMVHEQTYNTWLAYSKAHPGQTAPGDMDIAIMSLNRNIGNQTGTLSYGYNNNNSTFSAGTIMNTFGYPAAGGYNGQQEEFSSGKIDGLSSDGSAILYNQTQITTFGGSSGSPVYDYFPSNGSRVVYGVVVGGSGAANSENFATRITQQIFTDFGKFTSQYTTTANVIVPTSLASTTTSQSRLVALVPLATTAGDVSVSLGLTVPTMKAKPSAFTFGS